MLMNYFKFLFFFILLLMGLLGWSSNNWIVIWFTMEFMFLFFMGLVSLEINYGVVEAMMKYYLVQVFLSLALVGIMIYFFFNLEMKINFFGVWVLLMKIGMVPFHYWVIMILGKLGWFSFTLMMTLMKLLPILMIHYLSFSINLHIVFMMSVIVGSLGGLNNTSIQKLLGYSSIVHVCWLLVGLEMGTLLFFVYLSTYFFMMTLLVFFFYYLNIYYINQLKMVGDLFSKYSVFFLILSMAGFPPFMGFIVKWVVASVFINFNLGFLFLIMLSFSLFSVIFYFQLFYYFLMVSCLTPKWYGAVYDYTYLFFFFFFFLLFYLLIYFIC